MAPGFQTFVSCQEQRVRPWKDVSQRVLSTRCWRIICCSSKEALSAKNNLLHFQNDENITLLFKSLNNLGISVFFVYLSPADRVVITPTEKAASLPAKSTSMI